MGFNIRRIVSRIKGQEIKRGIKVEPKLSIKDRNIKITLINRMIRGRTISKSKRTLMQKEVSKLLTELKITNPKSRQRIQKTYQAMLNAKMRQDKLATSTYAGELYLELINAGGGLTADIFTTKIVQVETRLSDQINKIVNDPTA